MPRSIKLLVEPARERRPVNPAEAALATRFPPAERAVTDLYLAQFLALREDLKLDSAPRLREFEHLHVHLDLVLLVSGHACLLSIGLILIKRRRMTKAPRTFRAREAFIVSSVRRSLGVRRLLLLAAGEALDLHRRVLLHVRAELLLQNHLLVELAHHRRLFVRRLRPLHLRLVRALQVNLVQHQAGRRVVVERDFLALREDFVPPVLPVPLRDGRVLVHLLDDVAPADAGVVGAETDLALLRAVGNDAHLGSAEVVIEQVLEPHARDEEEVPAVGAAGLDVLLRALAVNATVAAARESERLVELLEKLVEREL